MFSFSRLVQMKSNKYLSLLWELSELIWFVLGFGLWDRSELYYDFPGTSAFVDPFLY